MSRAPQCNWLRRQAPIDLALIEGADFRELVREKLLEVIEAVGTDALNRDVTRDGKVSIDRALDFHVACIMDAWSDAFNPLHIRKLERIIAEGEEVA